MMIERMILKGMFERFPNLRLCLSHGGGLLAFNIWRLDHSYSLRPQLKAVVPRKPSEYLKRFYFDTIVHSREALEFLVGSAGAARVLLGSDYPFDMGTPDGVSQVRGLAVAAADQETILGGAALRLLDPSSSQAAARAFA